MERIDYLLFAVIALGVALMVLLVILDPSG
jgi:hypothetical protein